MAEPEPAAEPETIPNAVDDNDDGYDVLATFLPSVVLATVILGGAVCSHLAAHWDEVEIFLYRKFGIDLQGKFKRKKTHHSRGSLLCPQSLESHLNLDSDDPGHLEVVLEDLEKFVASMQVRNGIFPGFNCIIFYYKNGKHPFFGRLKTLIISLLIFLDGH
ncbi:hypothetical protein BSKO_07469 [Bryopsis sp. KO-2023]|nr:hypothetical protein BSKO_07469 [Bryopsis sp. KO-2023]